MQAADLWKRQASTVQECTARFNKEMAHIGERRTHSKIHTNDLRKILIVNLSKHCLTFSVSSLRLAGVNEDTALIG